MADDVVVFHKHDLPNMAFPMFEEIRRRGKLCDVTLKVSILVGLCNFVGGNEREGTYSLSSGEPSIVVMQWDPSLHSHYSHIPYQTTLTS